MGLSSTLIYTSGLQLHWQISYGGGLGTSPCIMGLTTQDPYIQKEHTKANIEQDTAIQNLKNCKEMYGFPDKCPTIHTFVTKFLSLNL